jgi:hypothetical protein
MSFWANVLLGKWLSGQMSFWANGFWANVFLGKCLSGQMSFWANVFWANVHLGKCPSGQMSFWANVFWANVIWANVVLGKCLWANVVSPDFRSSPDPRSELKGGSHNFSQKSGIPTLSKKILFIRQIGDK